MWDEAAEVAVLSNCFKTFRQMLCDLFCREGRSCADAERSVGDRSFIFVARPRPGESVRSGFSVRGCSRTFESNVPWKLLDESGRQVAGGASNGGGVDNARPFAFTVSYSVGERQIGHLEVLEDATSEGQPRTPARNVIPVVLLP